MGRFPFIEGERLGVQPKHRQTDRLASVLKLDLPLRAYADCALNRLYSDDARRQDRALFQLDQGGDVRYLGVERGHRRTLNDGVGVYLAAPAGLHPRRVATVALGADIARVEIRLVAGVAAS